MECRMMGLNVVNSSSIHSCYKVISSDKPSLFILTGNGWFTSCLRMDDDKITSNFSAVLRFEHTGDG